MNELQLKLDLEKTQLGYQKLSQAVSENDTVTLLLNYGCLKNANDRLNQLSFLLSHIGWKGVQERQKERKGAVRQSLKFQRQLYMLTLKAKDRHMNQFLACITTKKQS